MSREYAELGRLSGGHTDVVTAISFSPRATYLATAATDNRICIWEVSSRKLLHEYSGSNYALCLTWMPARENHLLCGMSDGYVISLSFSLKNIRARGLVLHSSAIEAIAVTGVRVASGSRREVRVWDWKAEGKGIQVTPCHIYEAHRRQGSWILHHEIEEPPTTSQEEEVSIAYLQWTTIRPVRLVVVYVEHGLRIFHARTWKCLLARLDDKPVARADLSKGDRLAVANPLSGFSIYSLKSGDLVRAFGHEVGQKRAPAVKFIESDKAIVGGSTVGEVNVWDIETGRKIQTLSHAGASYNLGGFLV
ncbi:WD40-repeat-containing domain protein [Cerioporus squamosus]|nr:WD40-repeat-containing domain protein [Cerioporus squamosus]